MSPSGLVAPQSTYSLIIRFPSLVSRAHHKNIYADSLKEAETWTDYFTNTSTHQHPCGEGSRSHQITPNKNTVHMRTVIVPDCKKCRNERLEN